MSRDSLVVADQTLELSGAHSIELNFVSAMFISFLLAFDCFRAASLVYQAFVGR